MCGIAGVIRIVPGEPVAEELLAAMAETMAHRGPDDQGVWVSADGQAGLAHRRLAIVDLSPAGHQPMGNADGSVQVTFNGEIYNFRQLRRELEARGHVFRSQCDTEVLVYLYEELGEAMVERLDGDFAFGIWDDRRKRLLLARDRAGVHPVYYTQVGDTFLFASEIKALLRHPGVGREIDEPSLYHYLTYLVAPPPRTLLRDVYKLPAATTLVLSPGTPGAVPAIRKYWEPLPGQYEVDGRAMDEQLAWLFQRAVEKRLMSDVPVGVLFSGGVDSTLNAASFQKLIHPGRVRTYTVGLSGTRPLSDESESARQMARRLGTEHHEIHITENDLLETAQRLAYLQDEPISDPVAVPLYFVTRLARETGTIVLHAGEGADELFCGYDGYRHALERIRRLWRPATRLPRLASALGSGLLGRSCWARHRKMADVLGRASRGQEFFLSSAVAYFEGEKAGVLAPDFRRRLAGLDSFDVVAPLYRRVAEAHPGASDLEKITFLELQLRLPELLLMRVDKMAMANSVEVRVPFLDRDLVDFALSVPESFKLRDGVLKEPLKRLAAGHVERELVYRPKRGFAAPIQEWFRSRLGDHLGDLLEDRSAELGRFFNLAALGQRLRRGPGTVNQAFQLWVVYNFANWWRSIVEVSADASGQSLGRAGQRRARQHPWTLARA